MITGLDHVVLLVKDIVTATAQYEALFGRAPSWRASHDGAENVFFTLDNTSLELIAPGKGERAEALAKQIKDEGEGLKSIVFAVSSIAEMHRRARRLGLEPEDVALRESKDEARGETRVWKSFRIAREKTHGPRLFFIEHDRPFAPSAETVPGSVFAIDHAVVSTPAPDRAAALYGARLGLDMALDRTNPDWGSRLMFFRCGDMIMEIAHSLKNGAGDGPDSIYGLTWRVADADAAQARMKAAGFNVSDVRVGRKPGTKVFTVRDKTCGVPTLMLQPSQALNEEGRD